MVRKKLIFCCFCLLFSHPVFASDSSAEPLHFVAMELPRPDPCLPFITETYKWLEKSLPEGADFKYLNFGELEEGIKDASADIILSEVGTAVRLQKDGVRPLLTAVSKRHSNPEKAQGSVFFTHSSRDDLKTLNDLKGKAIVATSPNDFTGYQAAAGEVLRNGIRLEKFFSNVRFLGEPTKLTMKEVVNEVIQGKADVGIVRTCFLEDSSKEGSLPLKGVALKTQGEFACIRSTDLYPNWTISSAPGIPPTKLRQVVEALLAMPPTADGMYWSLAPDFSGVHQLMKELKEGQYEFLQDWNLRYFVKEYSSYFFFSLLFVLGLILHSWRAHILVKRRTLQLEKSFNREKELEKKSRQFQAQFEQFQKATIVGQLSSIIAHEIKQPLHVISCYSHGLLRAFDTGREDREVIRNALEKLEAKAQDAGKIIDTVRNYAKEKKVQKTVLDLDNEIRFSSKRFLNNPIITFSLNGKGFRILANPLEIQLVVSNLLKNALEAVKDKSDGKVLVESSFDTVNPDAPCYILKIQDNGPRLSDEVFNSLGTPLMSGSEDGMGLGICIIKSLLERYRAKLIYKRTDGDGLIAEVRFPAPVKDFEATQSDLKENYDYKNGKTMFD